jgi:hypothetical protein
MSPQLNYYGFCIIITTVCNLRVYLSCDKNKLISFTNRLATESIWYSILYAAHVFTSTSYRVREWLTHSHINHGTEKKKEKQFRSKQVRLFKVLAQHLPPKWVVGLLASAINFQQLDKKLTLLRPNTNGTTMYLLTVQSLWPASQPGPNKTLTLTPDTSLTHISIVLVFSRDITQLYFSICTMYYCTVLCVGNVFS